jgi:hypothetical protein
MQQFSSLEQFIVIVVVAHGLSLDSISSKMQCKIFFKCANKKCRQWQTMANEESNSLW